MTTGRDSRLEDTVADLARRVTPEIMAAALEEARIEARDVLRRRLVDAILAEAAPAGEADAAPPAPVRSRPAPDKPALYVYGFVPSDDRRAHGLAGIDGIDGAPTYTVQQSGVTAVVGEVAASPNSWADGSSQLADLAPYLEQHERVLEEVLSGGDVLPMRLGTCYPSADDLRRVMTAHAGAICAALERIGGTVEWGLTVTWNGPPDESRPAPAGRGRDYLAARQVERERADAVAERASRLSARVHDQVARAALAGMVLSRTSSSSDGAVIILRASYLVDRHQRSHFEKAIVDALAVDTEVGLSGELTGPWPPYHFASLDIEEVAV